MGAYKVKKKMVYVIDGKICKKSTALLLWLFTGLIGGHKYYEGKIGMGILYTLTVGICGLGWIIDFFCLITKPKYYTP